MQASAPEAAVLADGLAQVRAAVCTRYGPPEVLQLQDVAKPVPGKKQVCIRVVATAVTSSDCYIRGLNLPLPTGRRPGWRWA